MTLSELLRQATSRGDVPGAVGIVLDRHGPVWSGAYGLRDTATGAAMADDTVFWIASMTKPLTAIAAMQLVERGLLSLDAPIADILPQLAAPQIVDESGGTPVLRPAHIAPTLRHLLTHTSGYAYPRWDAGLQRTIRALGIEPSPRTWDDLARMPLVFEPGTRWAYGIGIDVVGKMIEAAAGAPLEQVIDANICRPLGMSDTCFVLDDAQRARAAPIHVRDRVAPQGARDRDHWVPSGPVGGRRMPFMAGGGGMYGTAGDYARLLAELLAGAPRLLSAPTWASVTANQIGTLQVGMLRSAEPGQSRDLDLAAGQIARWGLAFMVNPDDLPGRRRAGSQFWSGLANTYFWLDPVSGIAGVLMMSVLPFGDQAAFDLFEAFERAAYRLMADHVPGAL